LFSVLAEQRIRPNPDQRLLVIGDLTEATRHMLGKWFRRVVAASDGFCLLKSSELLEVVADAQRDDLFICGVYDRGSEVVVLYRGSLEPVVVAASWFEAGPGSCAADLGRLSVADFGHTVCAGSCEIAADAILYEFDAEFRKRARKRAVEVDTSLGGSIRRLRLQKGLTQSDFDLPLKTIARIERGEVKVPQPATLRTIARRLGVSEDELETY
jgi:hypothetical protein